MARPLWFVKILEKTFPQIKFLAKLTRMPLLTKVFENLLFKGDQIYYLPKDKVISLNLGLNEMTSIVLPSQILEHFINKSKYHWIMNFCICRDSMHCKDYPIDLGCLFLGAGVLDINPQLGRRVSKEEAIEHLKKCDDAGLVHMIGRNLLDKQWLGVKDGERLLSICNCDPCCCLWRISPILEPKIGSKVMRLQGIKVKVNEFKCSGCQTCQEGICFVHAISMKNDKAFISEECRGCGRCIEICPQKAIEIEIKDAEYINETIMRIESIINVD
jgi:ferredoxin